MITLALPSPATLYPLVESRRRDAFSFVTDEAGCRRTESLVRLTGEQSTNDVLGIAAELFASVVSQRPFARGNEALAVALITDLFLKNGYALRGSSHETMREQLLWLFPRAHWEDRADLPEPHQALLYHLARVLADPTQKGTLTVAQEQAAARHLLSLVARRA